MAKKSKNNVLSGGTTFNAKFSGRSGTLINSGVYADDHISELIGPAGHVMYEKMLRSDTQVGKVYYAIVNPIKSANWDIKPASSDNIDLQAAALVKQVLFKDTPRGFRGKLDEILTYPFHGFAAFEVAHKNIVDGPKELPQYTTAVLAFRDQTTIEKWHHDEEGVLLTVNQKQSGDIPVDVDIDAKNLLLFFNEKKGNTNGFPMCRRLYGPYKRKLLAKQLQMIGIERSALPVPRIEVPASVKSDDQQYLEAKDQLEKFTNGETAYFMTPEGWAFSYDANNTFDPEKVQTVIKSENEDMSGVILATFLEMGIGGNSGARSSTGNLADFFRMGILYLADGVCAPINNQFIPNICRLNFGDTLDSYPELAHSGISEEAGEELMRIVTGYVKDGVVQADEPLEDHVRQAHNLPKKAEGELLENKQATNKNEKQTEEKQTTPKPKTEEKNKEKSNKKDEGDTKEFAEKTPKKPDQLIKVQSQLITNLVREQLTFTRDKLINDVVRKYKQLPEAKKQKATDDIKLGGVAQFRKRLNALLTDTSAKALVMARKEVPTEKEVKLSSSDEDFLALKDDYGFEKDINLADNSKLPPHLKLLIAKQAGMISEASAKELEERVAFQFSASELTSNDIDVIKKDIENAADQYIASAQMDTKGTVSASTIINETRKTYFFADEVKDQIHSYTYMNDDPKSDICQYLQGTTVAVNDTESLRYYPPLHHNCKTYMRANLKTSKGVDRLEIQELAPSEKQKASMTLRRSALKTTAV